MEELKDALSARFKSFKMFKTFKSLQFGSPPKKSAGFNDARSRFRPSCWDLYGLNDWNGWNVLNHCWSERKQNHGSEKEDKNLLSCAESRSAMEGDGSSAVF